jgi:hypothetical protein
MSARRFRRVIGVFAVLATVASCAREHPGDTRTRVRDGDASDPATQSDASVRRSDPQAGPLDAAGAPPRIELLEGASWPSGLWVGQSALAEICRTDSRRVSVRFESDGEGGVPRGHVVFGEHENLAPVDPAHGYPESHVQPTDYRCHRDQLYDGYPYSIRAATVWPDGRMTIWLSPGEMYDDWCVMQTSYPASPEEPIESGQDHTCVNLPVSKYRSCRGSPEACPIDYDKFWMCTGNYCYCTENGCRAPFFLTVRMDLTIVGERMEGVILAQNITSGTAIKFRRVE